MATAIWFALVQVSTITKTKPCIVAHAVCSDADGIFLFIYQYDASQTKQHLFINLHLTLSSWHNIVCLYQSFQYSQYKQDKAILAISTIITTHKQQKTQATRLGFFEYRKRCKN